MLSFDPAKIHYFVGAAKSDAFNARFVYVLRPEEVSPNLVHMVAHEIGWTRRTTIGDDPYHARAYNSSGAFERFDTEQEAIQYILNTWREMNGANLPNPVSRVVKKVLVPDGQVIKKGELVCWATKKEVTGNA